MATLGNRGSALRTAKATLRSRGFTLIEMVIVVLIIAILAAIAIPSYNNYITKTRRNAASGCLSQYANYMERYYTTNLRYDQDTSGTKLTTPPALGCSAAAETGDYYQYAFAASQPTQSTYTILAKPQGTQASRDTQCATLGIDQTGQRYYQSTKSDSAGLDTCWK
ncbi:MAG TPA: type IV pilin protein [Rhodanobacteraceae bacterium]|nr:type IV pilin protein [Rhodanobacteraceae bacterium]